MARVVSLELQYQQILRATTPDDPDSVDRVLAFADRLGILHAYDPNNARIVRQFTILGNAVGWKNFPEARDLMFKIENVAVSGKLKTYNLPIFWALCERFRHVPPLRCEHVISSPKDHLPSIRYRIVWLRGFLQNGTEVTLEPKLIERQVPDRYFWKKREGEINLRDFVMKTTGWRTHGASGSGPLLGTRELVPLKASIWGLPIRSVVVRLEITDLVWGHVILKPGEFRDSLWSLGGWR